MGQNDTFLRTNTGDFRRYYRNYGQSVRCMKGKGMCHPGDHTVVEYYIVQVTRLSENMRMQKLRRSPWQGGGLLRGMPPPPAAIISPECSRDLGAKLRRLAQSPATQRLPTGGRGTPSCRHAGPGTKGLAQMIQHPLSNRGRGASRRAVESHRSLLKRRRCLLPPPAILRYHGVQRTGR